MPFEYSTIINLYNSSGVIIPANKGTYTHLTREIILELRGDIDLMGEALSITGSNWTDNNFDWDRGSSSALDTDGKLWISYITDLRTAIDDLWTAAGLSGSPSWTISDVNLKNLYLKYSTATISGSVLSQTDADFTDITDSSDYAYIISGTGVTPDRYQITAHTTGTPPTLTLSTAPGDSSAGDVIFEVLLDDRKASFTDIRNKSLYQDVRDHLITLSEDTFLYVDQVNGNDSTGDGSESNPYKTWDKVVTEANTASVSVFLRAGDYSCGVSYAVANGQLIGDALGEIVLDIYSASYACVDNASGVTVKNIYFGDGTFQQVTFRDAANLYVQNCIFRGIDDGSSRTMWAWDCTDATFFHCGFMGVNKKGWAAQIIKSSTQPDTNFDSCYLIDVDTCILTSSGATHDVNLDHCAYYNFNTKHSGDATFNVTNEFSTSADPLIDDISTAYLRDDSPYVDEASDGFDIGGHSDGPYNFVKTASDSISITDSTEMALTGFADDTINITEDVTTTNMNISIDMLLGGLFQSSSAGVVTYRTSSDVPAETYVPDLTYNGAALDVSWDNSTGDLCKVYVAVDDGVTDYTPASWWIVNAVYPAISTTQTVGTRGYGIDLYTDAEASDEWGDWGDFSTVTADGVNDQQWDIALKVRIHNTITNQWSEVISISKTYNFNDFDKTLYWGADNPRVINGEYANHANYYAQTYHTGTNKYTRIDGVDWSADGRRFAYNPMFKAQSFFTGGAFINDYFTNGDNDVYQLWKDRKAGPFVSQPLGRNAAEGNIGIFFPMFVNYGNWNNASAHCFASPSTTQPYDGGTANFTSPVLSSSSSDIRYLFVRAYAGSDCNIHSSNSGLLVRMPSGENWGRSDFFEHPAIVADGDIYYLQADNPHTHCLPDNNFYLFTIENDGITPGGYTAWWSTHQQYYVNTDSSGSLDYGILSPRKLHAGNNSFSDAW